MYATTRSLLRSLTVTAQYDGFHKCPPHSSCFNSGCERNNWRARFPFIIFIMSDIKNCGLQSRSKWIMIWHNLHRQNLKFVFLRKPIQHFFTLLRLFPFFRTLFSTIFRAPDKMILQRIHISSTIWKCISLIVNISFSMFILYHMTPHLANTSSASW